MLFYPQSAKFNTEKNKMKILFNELKLKLCAFTISLLFGAKNYFIATGSNLCSYTKYDRGTRKFLSKISR
jgi:hypothetical protein